MRKINLNILMGVAFLSLCNVSCDGFLDKNPLISVSDDIFWNNEEDVKIALAGVYSRLQENFMGYERVYYDALSDNAFPDPGNSNQANIGSLTIGGISPGLGGAMVNMYSTPYKLVSSVNYFLDNIDKANLGESRGNNYKAEARFLRALAYFELVQQFGGVVIYRNFVSELQDVRIPKSSIEEVYEFIYEDLDFAIQHLSNEKYNGHAVKASAQGIKARALMVQNKWTEAIPLLREIINDNKHGLADDYASIFTTNGQAKDNINKEILFSTCYLAPNNVHRLRPGAGGLDIELGWYALMQPYQNLVNAYGMKDGKSISESSLYDSEKPYENRDPRLYATVKLPTDVWRNPNTNAVVPIYNTYTGFHTKKYVDLNRLPFTNATAAMSDQDYIHLRYADILLMLAEALNESAGPSIEAYDLVDQIRGRKSVNLPAIDKTKYSTQSALREQIRNERRVEFALEGHRYHDLKRWKIAHEVLPKLSSPSGIPYVFEQHNYYLPFTITELDNNPNLIQNEGY
ncbi:RagB/SusD family nutrient uptake outer membrane protein [Sphingobacterium bovistauri]|uniref:RagB/SusD family nutrient uptake outer membrane protein n=1 Tax=Sphingobacterium bovistauri TaxID=2781959 RepID=A0ABS7Z3Y9_9SPHI|nr:RagB/SusD family nutrient uptake outer membrane protein [Sphingobacterium bovistauri]MCA5004728.1 RagB/SusD family nutrient uptake outer membrane protein [Sphingobacterium bovistauri]